MIKWTDSQNEVLKGKGNLLISASAGSGKTTIMLEKVIKLLKEGYELNRFLVMTFSNASAAEMKEKLIEKLYQNIKEGGREREHLKKQLDLLNFSDICTIDSFCFGLYKKYFAEIGLDPSFELMDEKEVIMLFWQSVDEVIKEYLEKEGDQDFNRLLERNTRARDINPLKETIKNVSDFLDVQVNEEKFIEKAYELLSYEVEKHPAVKFYLDHHRKNLRKYEEQGLDLLKRVDLYQLNEKYKDIINIIINNIKNVYKAKDLKNHAHSLKNIGHVPTMPNKPKDSEVRIELSEEIKSYKKSIKEYLDGLRKDLTDYYLSGKHLKGSINDVKKLLEITQKVKENYKNTKIKNKKFDFADLSRIALEVLEDGKRRKEIQSLYDFVFMDEYQDTNYIQETIMNLVSSKNNLFMVGDPKQAIYQFRHAEPGIFINRYLKYENQSENGENRKLNENFRSDSRILDFVNLVFREVMFYEFGGVDYKNNSELSIIEGQEYPIVSSMQPVEIALYENQKNKEIPKGVYSVKEDSGGDIDYDYDSAYIIKKINSLVNNVYIYDSKLKQKRQVEYKDIAILMYRRNTRIIEELKKEKIPFTAPGFNNQRVYEIDILVDCLRVVDNMANDTPLSVVMHSPLYSFTVKEMLDIRKCTNKKYFWEAVISYKGNPNTEIKIKKMLNDFERYRFMLSYSSVYDLMLRILCDGYDAYLLSQGEEIVEVVNCFVDRCKDREYAKTISSFIEYYDTAYDNKTVIPSMGNSVKVMTIHSSKGLEFPIVFVAKAHEGYTHIYESVKDLLLDNEFGVCTKYYDTLNKYKQDTLLTKGFKLKKTYKDKEELLRLMYVAFTRAKNHLFIVGENSKCKNKFIDKQSCFVEWLNYAKEKNNSLSRFIMSLQKEEIVPQKEGDIGISRQKEADLCKLNEVYKYEQSTISALKYSVSALKKGDKEEDTYEGRSTFLTSEKSIKIGVAYHKIMELLNFDLTEKEEIIKQINTFADNGEIEKEILKEIDFDAIVRTMNSEIINFARKNKYEREKSFMLYVKKNEVIKDSSVSDKILVQGVIDLLITGEQNIIVDFKVTQSASEQIKERYQKQLELYSIAVEKLLNLKVDRKIVYVINRNLTINI